MTCFRGSCKPVKTICYYLSYLVSDKFITSVKQFHNRPKVFNILLDVLVLRDVAGK